MQTQLELLKGHDAEALQNKPKKEKKEKKRKKQAISVESVYIQEHASRLKRLRL